MKKITSILLKKKWILKNTTAKRPHLYEKNRRVAGKVLCVIFNKFSTFFEVTDFIKTSKKQRSNVVDAQIKDIFQYNFLGICISQKKDKFLLNSSYIIRNTFDKVSYEMNINLYSPVIETIFVYPLIDKILYKIHNKYYYLRKKPLPMSTIEFDYVTDMYEQESVIEQNAKLNEMEKRFM